MRVVQGGSEWQPPDRQHEAPGLGTGGSVVVGNWLAPGLGNSASPFCQARRSRTLSSWLAAAEAFSVLRAVWDGHAVCHAPDLGLRISGG